MFLSLKKKKSSSKDRETSLDLSAGMNTYPPLPMVLSVRVSWAIYIYIPSNRNFQGELDKTT